MMCSVGMMIWMHQVIFFLNNPWSDQIWPFQECLIELVQSQSVYIFWVECVFFFMKGNYLNSFPRFGKFLLAIERLISWVPFLIFSCSWILFLPYIGILYQPFTWNKNITFCIFWSAEYSQSGWKNLDTAMWPTFVPQRLILDIMGGSPFASSSSQLSKTYATCLKRRFLAWEIWVFPVTKKIPLWKSWYFL